MNMHGMSHTSLYYRWCQMRSRCRNANNSNYKYYGGRGISVCKEWNEDFMIFYTWAMNNGYKQELEIDRINNDGNYEPNNCQWITKKENLAVGKKRQREENMPPLNCMGVIRCQGKYKSHIYIGGKRFNLGIYDTVEEAKESRNQFRAVLGDRVYFDGGLKWSK